VFPRGSPLAAPLIDRGGTRRKCSTNQGEALRRREEISPPRAKTTRPLRG
jgi:hypothetical protein